MTATGRGRLPARRAFVLQLEFGTNFLPNTSALCFAGPITLVGAGAATTIIDGDQRAHVAVVGNNGPVEIRGGGTLRNGRQTGGSLYGGGGGINASGMLTLADSVVSDSSSVADGGGIFNSGTLTVLRSAISRNVTGIQQGGGVWNYQLAVATIIDSLIDENAAAGHGGGLSNYTGTMTVTNSTVKGNQASQGGGLDNAGASANGPAIAHLRSVTIADNLARWFGDPNRGHGGGVVNTEVCPRSVAPPHAVDPFPDGSIKDKGCGARKPDRTLGGDVLVDVQAKP